jgi:hypothetical protein
VPWNDTTEKRGIVIVELDMEYVARRLLVNDGKAIGPARLASPEVALTSPDRRPPARGAQDV